MYGLNFLGRRKEELKMHRYFDSEKKDFVFGIPPKQKWTEIESKNVLVDFDLCLRGKTTKDELLKKYPYRTYPAIEKHARRDGCETTKETAERDKMMQLI
jgi:hypothetical protein